MSTKSSEAKALILLEYEKFKNLEDKSKKLNNMQHQQIPTTELNEVEQDEEDKTKMLGEQKGDVIEQKKESVSNDELENNALKGGSDLLEEKIDAESTNEAVNFTNWYKVL